MDKENYKEELSKIAEQLAYVSFTKHGYDILSKRGVTHEDINNFVVTMFFATFINDKNEAEVELDVQFTVYVQHGERNNQEITFMFTDREVLNAIINKVYNSDFNDVQKYTFKFGKPNAIQLFDAQLVLDHKLELLPEEDANFV